jgi:hypothetical protein
MNKKTRLNVTSVRKKRVSRTAKKAPMLSPTINFELPFSAFEVSSTCELGS